MTKTSLVYQPRIVGGKVMMPADLKRLNKYMLDKMRAAVESEWPELAYKLPPKTPGVS
jgi:hypothetical protein